MHNEGIQYKPEQFGTAFGYPEADFMTVTTYSETAIGQLIRHHGLRDGNSVSFRGYSGLDYGNVQVLKGTQKGRAHYIVNYHGSVARLGVEALVHTSLSGVKLKDHFSCTRLDVQLSVKATPEESSLSEMHKELGKPSVKWNRTGHKPKLTLIQGEESARGMGQTLYVGSSKTKSGYFTRMYEKRGPEGNRHIRFEVQFKRKRAQAALDHIARNPSGSLGGVLKGVISTYPISVREGGLKPIADALERTEGVVIKADTHKSDDTKKYLWFKYDVCPALMRVTDEDVSLRMEALLYQMAYTMMRKRTREGWWDRRSEELGRVKELLSDMLEQSEDVIVDSLNELDQGMMGREFEQMSFLGEMGLEDEDCNRYIEGRENTLDWILLGLG